MKVCLAPSRVLCNQNMGGHAWVYANWTLGLVENGCEVVWLERFDQDTPAEAAPGLLRTLRTHLSEIGLDVPIALCFWPGQDQDYASVMRDLEDLTVPLSRVLAESDLLLNFYYGMEKSLLHQFKAADRQFAHKIFSIVLITPLVLTAGRRRCPVVDPPRT